MRARFIVLIMLWGPLVLLSQPASSSPYQYLYPRPNSTGVHPETNIIVRFSSERIAPHTLRQEFFRVVGSKSGTHNGRVALSDDGQTILFQPEPVFTDGEDVQVTLLPGIVTTTGAALPQVSFTFRVDPWYSRSRANRQTQKPDPGRIPSGALALSATRTMPPLPKTQPALPSDFPPIRVLKNATPGGDPVFLGSVVWGADSSLPYLMILNRDGSPAFYRKVQCWGLTLQPNGVLTYFDVDLGVFVALDSAYTVTDFYECGNGYPTDNHELRILPNSHAFLMCVDRKAIPMDTIVPGGDPNALVEGLIIQELDRDKNVVFEWRSWDHFQITDATDENLTAPLIDYVHANSIEIDTDGNIVISCRNMDEITKIDRTTGDIIWRWGGKHNEFTFVNDPLRFNHQHALRRLPGGTMTMFDNGNDRESSRAVEYALDEHNKTATLVWEYRHTPDIFGWALGYTQRLPDGNTLIAWGAANPTVTEVTPQGTSVYEMAMHDPLYSYRVYSFPWRTTAFVPSRDTLTFADCAVGDSSLVALSIVNPTDNDITLTSLHHSSSSFSLLGATPLSLAAHESTVVQITYTPHTYGVAQDTLEIGSVDSLQGIFVRVFLHGASPAPGLVTIPSSVHFGEIAVRDTARKSVMFADSSVNPATVDSIYTTTRWFSVNTHHRAAGQADSLIVSFTSDSSGVFVDTLHFVNTAGTIHTRVPLSATCPARSFSISADSLEFGSVDRGDSTTRSIVLRNIASYQLTVTGLTVQSPVFKVSAGTPLVVNGRDTLLIPVQFAPVAYGTFRDTLHLTTNGGTSTVCLRGKSADPSQDVDDDPTALPTAFSLSQNYPNPFNPSTTLDIALPLRSHVRITIYDAVGREVGTLVDDILDAGYHQTQWRPDRIASGVYVCRLSATPTSSAAVQASVVVRKLLLIR